MAEYPPVGFHFSVSFSIPNSEGDFRFQEVTGLEVEMELESFKEGGQNQFVWQLPKRTRYQDITLKRGMVIGSKIVGWCKSAFENFVFEPCNVQITLLNEKHEPVLAWSVINAIPKKWSISGFNAEQNSIVIESFTLSYQFFKVISM
jgi:phage tail-like protein